MRVLPAISIVLAGLALGSCSYSYQLLAKVIQGRLAFVVDPASGRTPKCINGITVSTDKGESVTATPIAGDDVNLIENGVFWWQSMEGDCKNDFPIFYGQPLKGKRLSYEGLNLPNVKPGDLSSVVLPKRLHAGVVYEVSTTSGSTGYGQGWFWITPDRRVENWQNDPTPALVNEHGYDVSGAYEPPAQRH